MLATYKNRQVRMIEYICTYLYVRTYTILSDERYFVATCALLPAR